MDEFYLSIVKSFLTCAVCGDETMREHHEDRLKFLINYSFRGNSKRKNSFRRNKKPQIMQIDETGKSFPSKFLPNDLL
jgi:hypothetical protein